jgi:endonuclease/exonuclease/phosphatase (EEP) superfamily protein YafD
MRFNRRIAAVFAFIVGALSILSLGGAFSDGLDILTHFAPFLLAGGVLALLMQAPRKTRDPLAAGFALAAVIIPAGLMAPELAARWTRVDAHPAGRVVKIIQMNVWSENRAPAATARWLAGQNADVVVLEEVVHLAAQIPAALRKTYPYVTPDDGGSDCDTRILSKVRPDASGLYPPPDPGRGGSHCGAWARFGRPGTGFTVVGAHMLWPIPPEPQRRQMDRLAQNLAAFQRASLILAGDFNSTPWSFGLHRLDTAFGPRRRDRALFTFPVQPYTRYGFRSSFPLLPLDHIFAGPAWRTVSVTRGPKLGSDHLAVVAVLTRRGAQ